jgi:CDP-glycerol glycerophosphotransferase
MAAERLEVLDRVCYHYRQRRGHSRTSTVSARHFDVFDQYHELFARADTGRPGSEVFVPELFRAMVDHYLVIVGNEHRVPAALRRRFFHRMAADFRTRLPAGGYERPVGVAGLKHHLVRRDAYRTYATLRASYRALRRWCRALHSARRRPRPAGGRHGDGA